MLKVGLIFIYHLQTFNTAQSTVPSSHEEPISVDLSDSQPICMHVSPNLIFLLIELRESQYQRNFLVK